MESRQLLFRAPGIGKADAIHSFAGAERTIAKARNLSFSRAVTQMTQNLDAELASFKDKVKTQKAATVSYRPGYSGGGSASIYGLILLMFLL